MNQGLLIVHMLITYLCICLSLASSRGPGGQSQLKHSLKQKADWVNTQEADLEDTSTASGFCLLYQPLTFGICSENISEQNKMPSRSPGWFFLLVLLLIGTSIVSSAIKVLTLEKHGTKSIKTAVGELVQPEGALLLGPVPSLDKFIGNGILLLYVLTGK